ncbi:MAG: GDP-mannose 4,6-dehydratase [Planctomycetes bacterium]|nr:GDP-mannose 4,6-dehydratase [Planctomycetota bacterium]
MKKILVTGAAGFIGYHLTQKLVNNGLQVIGIDCFDPYYDLSFKYSRVERLKKHPSFRFHTADLRDKNKIIKLLKRYKPEIVVHLAARAGVRSSVENADIYFDLNVKSTLCLLEALKTCRISNLIFASSSSVYGDSAPVPFSEEWGALKPLSPYGITKLAGEHYVRVFAQLNALNVIMLRIFTCYGPEQRPDMGFHKFAKSIINREPIVLFDNGRPKRDFTFVSDTVEYIYRSVYKVSAIGGWDVFNLANSNPVTIKYTVDLLQKYLGIKAIITNKPLSMYEPHITYGDNSKAIRFFGYKPNVSIEAGLKPFCRWIKTIYDK